MWTLAVRPLLPDELAGWAVESIRHIADACPR